MRYFVALKRTSEQQQNPPRFNLFRAKMNSQGLWIFFNISSHYPIFYVT